MRLKRHAGVVTGALGLGLSLAAAAMRLPAPTVTGIKTFSMSY